MTVTRSEHTYILGKGILFYFYLATLTYSPKSYGFLINFSLIMLDSPWLLFSLSTWLFFVLDGFRGSS